jgi:hypothetical protein
VQPRCLITAADDLLVALALKRGDFHRGTTCLQKIVFRTTLGGGAVGVFPEKGQQCTGSGTVRRDAGAFLAPRVAGRARERR